MKERMVAAYAPEFGYKYQLLCRLGRVWEHCDYAVDDEDKNYLMREYMQAYGPMWDFMAVQLPQKYWKKEEKVMAE